MPDTSDTDIVSLADCRAMRREFGAFDGDLCEYLNAVEPDWQWTKSTIRRHVNRRCKHVRERQTKRITDGDILGSVRKLFDDSDTDEPPTQQEMDENGIVSADAARRRFDCGWREILERAGVPTRRGAAADALREFASTERTWATARRIKTQHAPEWLRACFIGQVAREIADGQYPELGLECVNWRETKAPQWRVSIVGGGGGETKNRTQREKREKREERTQRTGGES